MSRRTIVIAASVAATAALAVGGVAWATSGGGEEPLSGDAKTKAVEAALAHVGGGTVLETEAGDDGAAYGVEIRLTDASVVEVQLDESFAVTGQEGDDDTTGEDSGADND
ncbi:MAG: hypothetical protein ABWY51_01000 [Gaiellaceae bacterium]